MVSLTPAEMSELLPAVMSQKNNKRVEFRQEVYDIVSWLYDNYKLLRDERAQALMKEAQTVLVAGLTDPDKQLRDKLYEFWTVNDHLAQNNSCSRLVDILRKLYSPSCEDMFLPIVINLLLQICEQTNEFNQNIFDNPLENCAFEKYHVSGSWRTQHAALVPMFADTLASQLSSSSLDSLDSLSNIQFQLRATQSQSSLYSSSLIVSMSGSDDEEASLYSFGGQSTSMSRSFKQGKDFGSRLLTPIDTTDGGSQIQSPKPILQRKRLLKDQYKVGREMARENTAKADRQERLLAERVKRREGEVRLTREYRKGDFPDIEIPRCSVIRALQTLARRDQLVARQLLVCLYKGLEKTQENIAGLSAALDNILKTSTRHLPILMASVLEMCLVRPEHCLTPTATITDVCKNSHQMSLGVLLIEAKLMANSGRQPPAKRARGSAHADDWVYLAEIYHSMEEKDVVQGLFEDKIAEACANSVREALQVEDERRWKFALQLYTQSLPNSKDSPAENFLYEACFKCFAHLSDWTKLNDTLKKVQLEGVLDDIWTDDWNKDHLLPWLFLSEIHCTQNTSVLSVADDFNRALSQWLADNQKSEHIRSHLGEYLSVIEIVKDDVQRSKMTCENSLLQFLSTWQQLDSLSNNLRSHHLLSLQSIMDIHHFLSLTVHCVR
ncbi:DNA-dependent protein kinase catalytic subunit-like [Homalodisca vitripennis]|uniref:DNA-dependent protein kinase catalytic subunit-like n=1 Tax=Homalodisca vitripennis TaxID=197043 RepID=UPI001EEBB1BD|nr:DNA-dependent protein kinase catalytic subunit-like [Homalodisca vitripennis]